MGGVGGAALWGVMQNKAKIHLHTAEYQREVLDDLKELKQLLKWQMLEKPWLEESREKRQVNSYEAQNEAFLWEKLCKDWIWHSERVKCHTTSEYLYEVNESIRLIREHGIKKALRIRRGEIIDLYQLIMELRKPPETLDKIENIR